MGAYLVKPNTEKTFENGDNENIQFVSCSMQGWRTSQEDSHNCIITYDENRNLSLFAVYDGHGGAEVAELCSKKLPDYIKSHTDFEKSDYSSALTKSFLEFDAALLTDEYQTILKELADMDTNKSAQDGESADEEEDPNLLAEEASMPLEKLLVKYSKSLLENGLAKNSESGESQTEEGKTQDEEVNEEEEDDEDYKANEEEDEDEEEEEEGESEEEEEDDESDEEEAVHPFSSLFGNAECAPGFDSGCTAVLSVLDMNNKKIIVANSGDSRCILCRNGKAIELSDDHKPEDLIELERIHNAGGKLSDDGRVNGGLNLSRAIGDHSYKANKSLELKDQMISSMPDIKIEDYRPEEDEYMVLACDGIWNSFTSQQLVDFIEKTKKQAEPDTLTSTQIVEAIFAHCLAPNTEGDGTGCDNMTCIIVNFKQHPSFKPSVVPQTNGNVDNNNHSSLCKKTTPRKRNLAVDELEEPTNNGETESKRQKTM